MKALKWLEELSERILKSGAFIEGQEVSLGKGLDQAGALILATRKAGRTIYWIGNGGSLALCGHLSQDVLNKLKARSLALNDPALITCVANDHGYENVFLHPLKTLIQAGDLLIAISSSGNSKSITNPVEWCIAEGINVLALSSFKKENKLNALSTAVSIFLPAELYGHAEVGHEALLHSVIETIWLAEK